jgi:hypothetical protein
MQIQTQLSNSRRHDTLYTDVDTTI